MKTKQHITRKFLQFVIVTLISIVTVSCNTKQKQDNLKKEFDDYSNSKTNNIITKSDSTFIIYASELSIEDGVLSQLVQQNTLNTDVLNLAKMIEISNNTLSEDLSKLALNKNITIPTIPTTKINDEYKLLSNKSGDDFDRTYCEMVIDIHKDAINLFDKISKETMDSEIRILTYATLINLRLNLDKEIKCKSLIN